ncbi:MAG: hypothetical protein CL940_09705 [Deltaproteobacteria bacterium]|nr:hypothetical protein [Deltaproteobacteria bacterium]
MSRSLCSLAALALLSPLVGCSDQQVVLCEGEVVNNTCVPWETTDTPVATDLGGWSQDTGGGPSDVTAQPDQQEEACLPSVAGMFPVGSACSKNCECSTGYCYDEAYLGEFRFCTKPCSEQCSTEDKDGIQSHICLQLGGQLAQENNLTQTSICMRVCLDVSDCSALSSAYDKCGDDLSKTTKWAGVTIAAQRTCQIASAVQ